MPALRSLILFFPLVALSACVLFRPLDDAAPDPEPTGAGGSGGSGGGGGMCSGDGECIPSSPCEVGSCVAGACTFEAAPAGDAPVQTAGDCLVTRCDGAGAEVDEPDDADTPDDENPCTVDSCQDGETLFTPKAVGTPCLENGVCDDNAQCYECGISTDCSGVDDFCQQRTCIDNVCGVVFEAPGVVLPATEQIAGDCQALQCDGQGGTMSAADDTDVPVDGIECTDDVCAAGVPDNPAVAPGTTCTQDNGQVCSGTACVECATGTDCVTGVCDAGFCVAAGCTDTVFNGTETDVDCGGSECGPCADGDDCSQDTDCESGVCAATCQVPSCSDNTLNGSETDIDCGGACPSGCAAGEICLVGSDCSTGSCSNNVCQTSSCDDALQNGNETDVDCGGSCQPCLVDQGCAVEGDCTTAKCSGGICTLFNECDAATAVDRTGLSTTTVSFGGPTGIYDPRCLRVTVGTDVVFDGNFNPHPLQGGEVIDPTAYPDPTSPFSPETTSGSSKTFPMTSVGAFPYFCTLHYGGKLYYGTVYVEP